MLLCAIVIAMIVGLTVAISYQTGIEQGYKTAKLEAEKVIHMETISIDENKWCRITKSIDRKI